MTTEWASTGIAAGEGIDAAKAGKERKAPENLKGNDALAWLDGYDKAKARAQKNEGISGLDNALATFNESME